MANSFSHLSFGALTDVGVRRKNNEDSIITIPEHGVYCVADGMGGAQGGEIASQAAVACLGKAFGALSSPASAVSVTQKANIIDRALNQASKWIKQRSDRKGITGAGTTAVVIAFDARHSAQAIILHAGDSRAYRFRDNQLQQLSQDHTVAAAAGLEDDAKLPSMFKGVVTRAVGVKSRVELERTPVDVRIGDVYLLSSDGLDKLVPDPDIEEMIRTKGDGDLNELAKHFVDVTNSRGGVDNVSVILVRVGEAAALGTGDAGDETGDEVPTGEIAPGEEAPTVDPGTDMPTADTGQSPFSDEFDFDFDEDELIGATPSRDSRGTDGSRPSSGPGAAARKRKGGIGEWLTENTLLLILGVVIVILMLTALQFFTKIRNQGQEQRVGFIEGMQDFDDQDPTDAESGDAVRPSARPDERDADQILAEIEMSMGGTSAEESTIGDADGETGGGDTLPTEPDAGSGAGEDPGLEKQRQAAEAEQARMEADRLAAEAEAARLETDRLAREAAEAEQARMAEAARLETERLAAEAEAARLEIDRLAREAAEAEQARMAEAARLETERLAREAAEAEQARMELSDTDARSRFPERIASTLKTGAWGALAVTAQRLEEDTGSLVEDADLASAFSAWTAAWTRADTHRLELDESLRALHQDIAARCTEAGFPAPSAPPTLSDGGEDVANQYCASYHALQDALVTPLQDTVSLLTQQAGVFLPSPGDTLAGIWWMAGVEEPDRTAELARQISDTQRQLTAIAEWIDVLPAGPVPTDVLARTPVDTLAAATESMDAVWKEVYAVAYNLPRQLAVWRNWEDKNIAPLLDAVDDFQYELVLDREEYGQDEVRAWRREGNPSNFAGLIRSINAVYPMLRQKTEAASR